MLIDLAAAGFDGDVLAPVSVTDATRRVLAFCTEPRSGWATYHLAARGTRASGLFDQVTTWSLFYANALAGRVDIKDVADFSLERRRDFAARVAAVPEGADLHTMDDGGVAQVVNLCHFGYPGVWGPKTTKMAALYRPRAVPVLDGHVAEVFGFKREGFSDKSRQYGLDRRERIDKVVRALATWIRIHRAEIAALREAVTPTVPEILDLPDLQLIDIVLWTSQDDKPAKRRPGQGDRWIDRPVRQHVPADELRPVPITIGG
ncbi:hypothetical protein GA0070617_0966 [Micromonospora yangpuensis]|uniref:Uncharacterized protein n=2 Tax=Micromonospora yangpuensis TaxID=683228 RepID=A0A1C6U412_9ACTN|nr:hypothetical protein GA0070617_0966 [Micromonospora yangpuensis]